jgi:DNA-binding transcriptional LysR family regulator
MTTADPMDLRSLEILVSTAELGSVSRAAAAHWISQPSASTRIRSLERRLGVELFARSASGTTLTAEGELVVRWARQVLAAAEEFAVSVSTLREAASTRLVLAASFTIGEHLVPRWLASFNYEHAGTTMELEIVDSGRVLERLRSGSCDVGFVEGTQPSKDLRSEEVGIDELVLVVSPSHPWARLDLPLPISVLACEPLVVRENGSDLREFTERALRASVRGSVRQPILELGSTYAVRAAVVGGIGPSLLSRLTVEADLADDLLVEVPVEGLHLRRTLRVVWRRELVGHPLVDLFVGHVLNNPSRVAGSGVVAANGRCANADRALRMTLLSFAAGARELARVQGG